MAQGTLSRFVGHYAMAGVLLLLCLYYSWATLQHQQLTGADAAEACAAKILRMGERPSAVLVVAGDDEDDQAFANALERRLGEHGIATTAAGGEPRLVRRALQSMIAEGNPPGAVAATEESARWVPNVLARLPAAAATPVVAPGGYLWPTFLRLDNLLNVANQIVVIAIIAAGMTLVIVTGGIDLSVGSLVALSAVCAARLIRDHAGGTGADAAGLVACSAAAVGLCGLVGAFSGAMVTLFRVPPFIATLAMMQVASGLAYILAAGQSIYDIPQSFVWLGRGADLGVPNAVVLMLAVYAAAHVLMSRTTFGRRVYAVGGNAEAARLSGVRVGLVLMSVYVLSGLAAGLGGVIVASQLKSGAPTYGASYELFVIAAVVVGGTSLSGGSGKVFGTLIGALIIAVIQNGMNLTGVESYRQKVVLGLVILGAVLLDMLKKRSWRRPRWWRPSRAGLPPPPPQDPIQAPSPGADGVRLPG